MYVARRCIKRHNYLMYCCCSTTTRLWTVEAGFRSRKEEFQFHRKQVDRILHKKCSTNQVVRGFRKTIAKRKTKRTRFCMRSWEDQLQKHLSCWRDKFVFF